MKIKTLAITFSVLLALVLITFVVDAKHKPGSFNSKLTDIDTAKVTSINIFPPAKAKEISLTESNKNWSVGDGTQSFNADKNAVREILQLIDNLTATRIAAKDKSHWADYKVNDSLATRVQLLADKKVVADIYIGKFSYQPQKNSNPYMGQPQGKMTTYVRLADENKIYATEGFLSMAFNRQISSYRDKTIAKVDKYAVDKINFQTPQGNFILSKQGNSWMVDGLVADSTNTQKYLSGLARLNSYSFVDESNKKSDVAAYVLSIEKAGSPVLKIEAYPADSTNVWAIGSSMNSGTYFSGKQSGLFEKLFPEKNYFIKQAAK